VSVEWRLDGAGRIVGALLPRGHPNGGPRGVRILAGEGIWPAEMRPSAQEISQDCGLVELSHAADPVRIVVHGPGGDLAGFVDQPGMPSGGVSRLTTGMRRDTRRVRIRTADRVWWLRASGVFGVRVTRGGGMPVYVTHGLRTHFRQEADDLDISVVLLTLASIPTSSYAPILGY
jgi:hypothetical protein